MKKYGERHFGGAFDIDPEEFWTREDLNEMSSEIEDKSDFVIRNIYLDEDESVILTYGSKYDNDTDYRLNQKIIMDYEKSDSIEEMKEYYSEAILKAISEEFLEYNKDLLEIIIDNFTFETGKEFGEAMDEIDTLVKKYPCLAIEINSKNKNYHDFIESVSERENTDDKERD